MKLKITARILLITLLLVFLTTPIVCAQEDKIGVFRPSTHQFILNTNSAPTTINYGLATDIPVSGDWNGDGLDEVGVFRPSTHIFYLRNGTTTGTISFGLSTDIPVSGDWNGDGVSEVGVFRPSTHIFYLRNGSTTGTISFGLSTDIPVSGDWNGDDASEVGVFRRSTHIFYLRKGATTGTVDWGQSTDIPVSGDWNDDSVSEVGVFRPSISQFILKNGAESITTNWGESTDIPVTGKWEPSGCTGQSGRQGCPPPQTDYKVYAEVGGVGWGSESANGFYDTINDGSTHRGVTWTSSPNPENIKGVIGQDDAHAKHWTTDVSDNWIGKADFLFFVGHGIGENPTGINFTKSNTKANVFSYGINRTGKVKWVAFDSCRTLHDNYDFIPGNPFLKLFGNGLHMLLGYDTDVPNHFDNLNKYEFKGQIFAELMKGTYWNNAPIPMTISNAWYWAGVYSHLSYSGDGPISTAVIYSLNCENDMLPGYTDDFCNPQNGWGQRTREVFPDYEQVNMNFRTLNLAIDNYSLPAVVAITREKAMIYKPIKTGYTKEWASSLAKSFGMSGNISETEDVFYADGNDANQFYFVIQKNTSMISFQKLNQISDIVQSESRSRSAAKTFLQNNHLMPSEYWETNVANNTVVSISSKGERQVISKTNVLWYLQQINGLPVFGARSMVEIDSDGNIVGFFKNWRDYEPYQEITLKSPEDAVLEFRVHQFQDIKGTPEKVNVTHISLGYQIQQSEDMGEYLEPVYIFEGNADLGDSIVPFEPVKISANKEVVNVAANLPPTGIQKKEGENDVINFSTYDTGAIISKIPQGELT